MGVVYIETILGVLVVVPFLILLYIQLCKKYGGCMVTGFLVLMLICGVVHGCQSIFDTAPSKEPSQNQQSIEKQQQLEKEHNKNVNTSANK